MTRYMIELDHPEDAPLVAEALEAAVEAYSDALTEAAATIRSLPAEVAWSSGEVATLLTGLAATCAESAHKHLVDPLLTGGPESEGGVSHG